ncbi:putative RNA methyltransferase [Collinsella intestinalis]|uniref:putative RNA methyltransferase n=1 Tax=Collinsella intestinalis TaxID=147207 RepID=UPI0025A3AEA5|nr:methyltransferase domain-containing protein [Collinsella intestinalis]MDM8162619.1 methyltransferase domain-containing protein [Collinsella intestinalis]
MDQRKLHRFDACAQVLACPICKQPVSREGTCLACSHGHRFDIARQGYVNLLRGAHAHDAYDRFSFEQRRRVFASGLYAPVAQAVVTALAERSPSSGQPLRVLDAGCGEGYFAEAVRRTGAAVCAFDISRDSIQLAAGQNAEDGILWFVADLAAIPVQDGAIDAVIDVFSPAHYGEFRRVLAPGGRVIKVVPTAHHLHEVRELAADQLRHSAYSNRRVIDHFAASCRLISRTTVSHTLALTPKVRDALIAMTPLLFSVDAAAIDWSGLTQATVEAEVLVGTW